MDPLPHNFFIRFLKNSQATLLRTLTLGQLSPS